MAFEITGKIIDILPVVNVSDRFRKREFVIEKKDAGGGIVFVEYIKFQLVQEKCDIIDDSFLNEEVKVYFNIKGNRWEKDGRVSYFTNLDAWKIEKISARTNEPEAITNLSQENVPPEPEEFSDLPF
ncbi:MAG TPA: DUF3127 domain-containing protein [Bacteroidales bacterium]|nr:DUF3127 domain-containing protein [Bacteroidales bacterium]HOK75243.1 DUF3127 domain-containing protein [Bacteroidales bacterium]HOM40690.1 DUF3127 domain-containing protein [Bacteroidales bacterium]HPP92354.1 DUF3127 domain-containing protein [Bacteroidales bacterium]HQG56616.1 DUF3127 domain-containing protein [Bacteroidales bacterium]